MKIKGLFLVLMAILLFGGSNAFAKSSSLENIVNNNNSTSSNVRTINNISNNDKQGNTIDNKMVIVLVV